jgi:UDP-glucose 4-epimerase
MVPEIQSQMTTDMKNFIIDPNKSSSSQLGFAYFSSQTAALCKHYWGEDNVVAADSYGKEVDVPCKFESLDVNDADRYDKVVIDNKIDYIVHLPAIMPDLGDRFPDRAIKENVNGCINAMNIACDRKARIFVPSSIAVLGG